MRDFFLHYKHKIKSVCFLFFCKISDFICLKKLLQLFFEKKMPKLQGKANFGILISLNINLGNHHKLRHVIYSNLKLYVIVPL